MVAEDDPRRWPRIHTRHVVDGATQGQEHGDDDQRQRQERKGPEFQPAPQPADDGAHRTEPGDTPAQWGDSGYELGAPHPAHQAYGHISQTPQPHESQPA